nr:hypothetical protein [uncultured Mediterranean phage uvMED]
MAQLFVAKELGMTWSQLCREMNPYELQLWILFFEYKNDQEQEAVKKAKQRRR